MTDKWTGQKTVLKEEDVDIIRRIQRGAAPSRLHVDYPVGFKPLDLATTKPEC